MLAILFSLLDVGFFMLFQESQLPGDSGTMTFHIVLEGVGGHGDGGEEGCDVPCYLDLVTEHG